MINSPKKIYVKSLKNLEVGVNPYFEELKRKIKKEQKDKKKK